MSVNVGLLPSGWIETPLGETATFEMGQAPAGNTCNRDGVGTIFVKAGEFGLIRPLVREWTTEPKKFARDGDVLICVVGATAGKLNLGIDCTIGRSVAAIRPLPCLLQKALYYQLLPYVEAMRANATGSAQGVISQADLRNLKVRIPPISEQTRIVEKLEELLSDLDAGVAELRAAQRKLVQYRQSLLKAAVEGALTADWRAARARSGEPDETGADLLQRILTERRARWEAKQLAKYAEQSKAPPKGWQAKYPEPVAPNTANLPTLPDGWVWASAEQLCDFITKGTTPPKGMGAGEEKTIPFLRVTNLTDTGELDFTDRVFVSATAHKGFLARSVVYPNDVLMNIVGPPLGQVSIVPTDFDEWNINQAIAIFRPIPGMLPRIIATCLLSTAAQTWLKARAKTTAGQTNLTLELCRELPIPLPPLEEQSEILAILETGLSALNGQKIAIDLSLRRSAAQRKNILKAAFAGQLVPQDPNDEPASALLERIRASRVTKTATGRGKTGRKRKETS